MMRGASFPEGGPIFLGKIAWGCQISWGANFPVTPVHHQPIASQPCLSIDVSLIYLLVGSSRDDRNKSSLIQIST